MIYGVPGNELPGYDHSVPSGPGDSLLDTLGKDQTVPL
jgi:hypothetical protein